MSVGFLSHKLLARALAADPRLGLLAADRQRRIAEHGPRLGADSNPIEQLRAACERIKNSTGVRQPNTLFMSASIIERMIAKLRAKIALVERLLGIGCEPEGKFPTGWPWTKRSGRPSKEEKRLRDCLPGWRSTLKGLEEPERVSNGGQIHILSARDTDATAQTMAVLHRHPDGQEMCRMTQIIGLTNPDVPTGHVAPMFCMDDRTRAISIHEQTWHKFNAMNPRRPTGKRAQRRAGKEWNR